MEGPPDNRGVNSRAIEAVLEKSKSTDDGLTCCCPAYSAGAIFDLIMLLSRYELELSMLEIYNESIRDLLRRPGTDATKLEAITRVIPFCLPCSVQIYIHFGCYTQTPDVILIF